MPEEKPIIAGVQRAVENIDETAAAFSEPKITAVGIPAVLNSLKMSVEQMGPARTARTLLRINQKDGFDCPGCAWPEGKHRSPAEFCENGAKAVAEEATKRRIPPAFFAEHSVEELRTWDDYSLGQQGRLTHPMVLDAGATHYREASWDEAFDLIAEELGSMSSPDEAIFYTSGRTSNEAAYLYQLFVRGLGTNNLPDCSNMCHESSGSALNETLGIGKGSVSLEDLHEADLIIIAGQNPGTNHPRMLTALEKAKLGGGKIIAVNPLPEAALMRYENPQTVRGMVLGGTALNDLFLQIKLGGDQALFQALGRILFDAETASPGTVFDRSFIDAKTEGADAYLESLRTLDWAEIETATGLPESQIREAGAMLLESKKTIVCWAMGLTQHKHSVPTLREVVNVLLLQGNIGKPGAGVCPVRGHSNVQGDRTMGIFEKMPAAFHDALDAEFRFASPRRHGFDTVDAIRAMRDGKARVFMAMGGNFSRATPDTALTEKAMESLELTVQVSTKLNRSHVATGRRAIILPTLGRTERDVQASGPQRVTVEDSMSAVHASKGRLEPASGALLSEVAIVTQLAERVLTPARGNVPSADWASFRADYANIRASISRVIPGFDDFEAKIDEPGGFILPNGPRDGADFSSIGGRAKFTVNELEYPRVPEGRLLLQTLRSHDQFNTTIYGKDDRYRGVKSARRVVFVNEDDARDRSLADGDFVDLVSEWPGKDGAVEERRSERHRIVIYSTPRGCAAAYYPETNVLVPLDSTADTSNTPTSKSVVIRLEPVA